MYICLFHGLFYCSHVKLTSILSPVTVEFNDLSSRVPVIVVVWSSPPGIGIRPHPRPWIIFTPFTCIEQDRFACLVQILGLEGAKHTTTNELHHTYSALNKKSGWIRRNGVTYRGATALLY